VQFEAGLQLHDAYRGFAREHGVRSAVVVAGIGMVKDPELGFFDGERYHKAQLRGAFELVSTQGNLATLEGEPFTHLHVSVAGPDHVARAGHLFAGEVHIAHEGALRALPHLELVRERPAGSQLASLRW
jgi:hypothetical protein